MRKIPLLASLIVILALAGAAVQAASSTANTKKPHTSILSRLIHHKTTPGATPAGAPMISGSVIGDKKTHVYHLPGDKYTLPSAKNRVYFKTEAQAKAAGYRHAGSAGSTSGKKKTAKPTGHGHMAMSHKMTMH